MKLLGVWRRVAEFTVRTLWQRLTAYPGKVRYRRAVKLLRKYGLMPVDTADLQAAFTLTHVLDKYSYANRGVRQYAHARRLIVQVRSVVHSLASDPTPEAFK